MQQGSASLAFLVLWVSVLSEGDLADMTVVRARVESCTHELKRIQPARTFVGQDLNFFHNVEFKNVPGDFPHLLFLNAGDEVVERIALLRLSREEINALLLKKGFFKRSHVDQEVPEKYSEGPYVEREEL